MRERDPGWSQIAGVMQRIAGMHQSQDCPVVPSVGGRVSSSCGSADGNPKEFASQEPLERDYVRAVLDCYLSLPGTSTIASRHDRRCAQQLFQRGVSLQVVKSAMVVAVARRTLRRGGPLPRVRAVHYFLPIVEELLEIGRASCRKECRL